MAYWNGGSGFSSSYRQETGFSYGSSSRSGTIASTLSTAYASSGSRFSTFSMEALAMHFDSLVIHEDEEDFDFLVIHEELNGNNMDDTEEAEEEEAEEEAVAVQDLEVGDVNVERWITALGVGWVLRLRLHYDGTSASVGEELDRGSRSWILAVHQIAHTFCLKRRLLPDVGTRERPSFCQPGEYVSVPDRYHLALFIQKTMLKMLAFVDAVAAWEPYTTEEYLSMDSVMQPSYSKLSNQHSLHDALSEASNKILMMFDSRTHVEVKRVENEIATLLSEYKSKLGKATRSTVEKIGTKLMKYGHDSSRPEGSLGVHEVTRSMMRYIRFLCSNYSLVDAAICDNYVLSIEKEQRFDGMTVELVSCLQKTLASISQSFSDRGLMLLFLLNNSYFIKEQYSCIPRKPILPLDFHDQIVGYMKKYLQESWAPLLSYLHMDSPYFCWGGNNSPLSRFESEFQKIYTTQKQWKVPDPELRRRLREVITNNIPGYTEYIEDKKVTNPKISPLELEMMLQELFEG